MSWGFPLAFLLLPLVWALPWAARLTGRARLEVPGPDLYRAGASLRVVLAPVPMILRILGLTALVIALARPHTPHHSTLTTSEGLDILLALDTSGSMRAEDFTAGVRAVSRLAVAKGVMKEFVQGRPNDRVGLVVFGEEAFTHIPLTLDHASLDTAMDDVRLGMAGEGGTAVGDAVAVAAKRLKDLDAPSKIIILLTDGQSNAGSIQPIRAAELSRDVGIKLYTVGIGQARRSLFGSTDGPDHRTLQEMATLTGGRHFRATDTQMLAEVYATIDELEPTTAEVEDINWQEEHFFRPLLAGLLLLLLDVLLRAGWLRVWP